MQYDVIFLGYCTDTERVYAGLQIFALSSDTEQMPLLVIEAAGLPVDRRLSRARDRVSGK